MKCIDALEDEHKTILLALNILDSMALRTSRNESVDPQDVESLINFLHTFADHHHQGKEETALFPELMKTAAAQTEPIRHMIFEHDQERSLVGGLEEALRTKTGSEFVFFARRLIGLLRNHIYKEDHILFETAEKALSTEQDSRISAEFRKIDGLVETRNRKARRELRRLEWKYLRKTGEGDQAESIPHESASRDTR